jgi:hypothetical protein
MTVGTAGKRLTFGAQRVVLPEHVVHRGFAQETIVLNLRTGLYHGLNATAGHMLETITSSPSLAAAAEQLAQEYGEPVDRVRQDLVGLVNDLLERDLVEIRHAAA